MENQEKLNRWLDKARLGSTDFQVLSRSQDGWNYRDGGQQDDVSFMVVGIWQDGKTFLYHKYDLNASINSGENFLAVIKDKDKAKMMIAVKNVGLFSFGMKDGATEKCKALLFARCSGWLSTIITATSDPPMVQVQQYIQDETDPLATIFPELFDHLVGNYSRKEVAENAGETGPSDFTNLGKAAATGTETQA